MSNNNGKSNTLLTNAIVVCVIAGASLIIHQLLAVIGVSGNLVWTIINSLFVILNALNGAYAIRNIMLPLKNDISSDNAAFILGLIGMIVSFVVCLWWGIDAVNNLIGTIQGNL